MSRDSNGEIFKAEDAVGDHNWLYAAGTERQWDR